MLNFGYLEVHCGCRKVFMKAKCLVPRERNAEPRRTGNAESPA